MDLSQLTPTQQRAVTHTGGPVIVIAGPGTGKTRTLVSRIAWLLKGGVAGPEEILAVTFTQKAAQEMRSRLADFLSPEGKTSTPWISTFHGFCLRFLQEKLPDPFQLLSESESLSLLRKTVQESFPDFPLRRLQELAGRIALAKNHLLTPEDLPALPAWETYPAWPSCYGAYQQTLTHRRGMDFDDLILETVAFLERHPGPKEETRNRFPFLLVDEFQDINPAQYRLFQLLTRKEGSWMVIGDPQQAIYGFRGSRPDFFFRLEQEYPEAERISLKETFRLNRTVLRAACQVLKQSPEVLSTSKPGPGTIPVVGLPDAEAEGEYIADLIEKELGGLSMIAAGSIGTETASGRRSLADIAVLYRLHAQGDLLADYLSRKGIPFQKIQETHWADRPEIRGLIGKLKTSSAADRHPLIALEEVLSADSVSFPAVGEGAEALTKLRQTAAAFKGSLSDFLEELALWTGLDTYEPEQEAVRLLTLHAAKGLEFPLVIIAGCEHSLLPLTLLKESDPEEERRLFYVGLTRAREKIVLTWAEKRTLFGRVLRQTPSPFLEDIESHLKAVSLIPKDGAKRRRRFRQLSLFGR